MAFFRESTKRPIGTGMWASRMERSTAGASQCCFVQTENPAETGYLAPCCFEVFFHDLRQPSIGGHVVGNRYPWPKSKRPLS